MTLVKKDFLWIIFRLIELVENHSRVFLSVEGEIPEQLEKYKLPIDLQRFIVFFITLNYLLEKEQQWHQNVLF